MLEYDSYDWTLRFCGSFEQALPYLKNKFNLLAQGWTKSSYRNAGTDKDNDPFDYIQEVEILQLSDSHQSKSCELVFESCRGTILSPDSFCLNSNDPILRKEIYDFLSTTSIRLFYRGDLDLKSLTDYFKKEFVDLEWTMTETKLVGWHNVDIARVSISQNSLQNKTEFSLKFSVQKAMLTTSYQDDLEAFLKARSLAFHSVPSVREKYQPSCKLIGPRLISGIALLDKINDVLTNEFGTTVDFLTNPGTD